MKALISQSTRMQALQPGTDRILKLDTSDTSALDACAYAADVSDWAKGSVAALVKAGCVSGATYSSNGIKGAVKVALVKAEN